MHVNVIKNAVLLISLHPFLNASNVSSNLRVRKNPSTSATVLGYVLNNQTVNITGKEGNWYKINFKGSVGYISSDYVKITKNKPNSNCDR